MVGHIHSIESFGTVDGPGVRLVIFFKGCPMRCLYCHNPDTWDPSGGTTMTVDEILSQYRASKSFYRNGGITATGGEPLLQMDFLIVLFEKAVQEGIHTTLDTSGITFQPNNKTFMNKLNRLLAVTNLILLDIKHINSAEHKKLTAHPNENILEFARYLDQKQVPVWIRHVVVPGITTNEQYLYELGSFLGTLHNIKALDVLPYHDMGKVKYKNMGIEYPLNGIPPLDKEDGIKARKTIIKAIKDKRQENSSKNQTDVP